MWVLEHVCECVCVRKPTDRYVHANNETERQQWGNRHNEKRIRRPWSITCLPKVPPERGHPLFAWESVRDGEEWGKERDEKYRRKR